MTNLPMKRDRKEEFDSLTTMANSLILLSHGRDFNPMSTNSASRVFECKTCNRTFPSFQALGGHRASHKRPRLIEDLNQQADVRTTPSPAKTKTHECSICGLEFEIGQALGGHMRRHRASMNDNRSPLSLSVSSSPSSVVNKSSIRRVLCLDLNLTPLENDDLEFRLQKMVPKAMLVGFYD